MPTITEDPGTETITVTETSPSLDQPWNVIVYDDPVNYMGFVALVFRRVFGYPDEKAEILMMQVHQEGKSVVWTGVREKAEFYVQQLQSYQLLAAMKKAA
tara:strand:+ start:16082 stop:16381 length:300 start_codon:yes stop_codon:yes gene_type:complete